MKKVWSILGVSAAVVALAPWKIQKNEEGELKLSALTWEAETKRQADGTVTVSFKPGLQDPRSLLTEEEAPQDGAETVYADFEQPAAEADREAESVPVLDPEEAADYADVPDFMESQEGGTVVE